jgi:hypothetical protein
MNGVNVSHYSGNHCMNGVNVSHYSGNHCMCVRVASSLVDSMNGVLRRAVFNRAEQLSHPRCAGQGVLSHPRCAGRLSNVSKCAGT